ERNGRESSVPVVLARCDYGTRGAVDAREQREAEGETEHGVQPALFDHPRERPLPGAPRRIGRGLIHLASKVSRGRIGFPESLFFFEEAHTIQTFRDSLNQLRSDAGCRFSATFLPQPADLAPKT